MNTTNSKEIECIGYDAAVLSATEIGVGSILHSLHVPLAGQLLSLNQCFILTRAVLRRRTIMSSRTLPARISLIAAMLKSLAPAGKKLTPMLAISAQGFLFSLGTMVFGANLFGILVGSFLLSLWAYLQPLLIYYFIFGKTLIYVADFFFTKLNETFVFDRADLLKILAIFVITKIVAAMAIGILAYRLPAKGARKFEEYVLRLSQSKRAGMASEESQKGWFVNAKLAAQDLLNPLFIVSLVLTFVFFVWAESDKSQMIWALLRPIAVGFVLFYVIRTVSFEWFLRRFDAMGWQGFSASFREAVRYIRKI